MALSNIEGHHNIDRIMVAASLVNPFAGMTSSVPVQGLIFGFGGFEPARKTAGKWQRINYQPNLTFGKNGERVTACKEHRLLSKNAAKEGMVLLLGDTEHESRLKKFFLIRNTITNRDETARLVDLRFEDQVVLRSGI